MLLGAANRKAARIHRETHNPSSRDQLKLMKHEDETIALMLL